MHRANQQIKNCSPEFILAYTVKNILWHDATHKTQRLLKYNLKLIIACLLNMLRSLLHNNKEATLISEKPNDGCLLFLYLINVFVCCVK